MGNFSDTLEYEETYIIIEALGIEMNVAGGKGDWVTISSPLRNDKNPSFSINIKTGAWKDFGTGQKGDIVFLVQNILGYKNPGKAIKWIKNKLNRPSEYFVSASPNNNVRPNNSNNKGDSEELIPLQKLKKGESKIIPQVKNYDLINIDTLEKFDCGIQKKWGAEWLYIPYQSGAQLYRREDGDKIIRHLKGSKPSESFFGIEKTKGKSTLLIAKSPREAMMLFENFGKFVDVIGIVSGENISLSKKQTNTLKKLKPAPKKIKLLFDCDTDQARRSAQKMGKQLAKFFMRSCTVELVNVWELSGKKFKDLNEVMKSEENAETIYEKYIAKGQSIKERNKKPDQIMSDQLDVKNARPHSETVYEHLPAKLGKIFDLIDFRFQKDVLLNATLPVLSAHMPNVTLIHRDGEYSPDYYSLIIAKPGSGKGIADKARKFGEKLNNYLIDRSKEELEKWKMLPKSQKEEEDKPVWKQLFLPGNSSSRAIYDFLYANNGRGLIFETEIDSLLNVTKNDWGNFTDILRKAFQHEPISLNRKENSLFIERPQLSIFMSGTFDQFRNMFQNGENGHFSRYAHYTFEAPLHWITHRPTNESRYLDNYIEEFSNLLFNVYQILANRDKPMKILLKERQWDALDDTFREKMKRLEEENLSRYLHSSNQRSAIITVRIASILCIIRNAVDVDIDTLHNDQLSVSDEDFTSAINLGNNYFNHAIRLFHYLPKTENSRKGKSFKTFYGLLPNRFETKEAYYIGMELNITKRTVRKYLKVLVQEGSLVREQHGLYVKEE